MNTFVDSNHNPQSLTDYAYTVSSIEEAVTFIVFAFIFCYISHLIYKGFIKFTEDATRNR